MRKSIQPQLIRPTSMIDDEEEFKDTYDDLATLRMCEDGYVIFEDEKWAILDLFYQDEALDAFQRLVKLGKLR